MMETKYESEKKKKKRWSPNVNINSIKTRLNTIFTAFKYGIYSYHD